MADEKGKEKTVKKAGKGKIVFFMILFGCLVPFGVPTLIVCLGFLPTFITMFTETDPRRPALTAIGYMNLAGVLPFLIDLWQQGQTMEAALAIVYQMQTWVIMLGAAGVGQLILYVVPPMVASIVLSKQDSRRRILKEAVAELESIWGEDIKTTLPIEVVRNKQEGKG